MMKRVLLLFGWTLFFSARAANLLPNETMLEIDNINRPKDWYGTLAAGSGVDKEVTPDKDCYSLRIQGDSCIETTVRVKGGHAYNCSWWLKTKDFNWQTHAAFQVVWMKQGKPLMTEWRGEPAWNMCLKNVQGSHDWTKFELNGIVAPADADAANVRVLQVFEYSGVCWYARLCMEEALQADAFANRIAAIPQRASDMNLDKAFDEANWKTAAKLSDYLTPATGAISPVKSETFLMYDKDALWVLCKNFQKNSQSLVAQNYKLGNGNCVEIFLLQPDAEYEYHAIVSVTDTLFTCREKLGDQSWPMVLHPWDNHGITYKLKVLENEWMVAVRIPFAGLKCAMPVPETEWRANFCRTIGESESANSSWSYLTDDRFQNAPGFGKLIFAGGQVPRVEKISVSQDGANVELCNTTGSPLVLSVAMVNQGKESANVTVEKTVTVPARQSVVCDIGNHTASADMRYVEIRENGKMRFKYSGLPAADYLALSVYDPENVRSQTQYIAVDTPFYMAFSMKHNFPSPEKKYSILERTEKAFDLYMEIPSCITVRGLSFDGIDWKQSGLCKPAAVTPSEDGSTVTYQLPMPFILNWQPHGYLVFYDCNAPEGKEYTGSYYFEHDGIKMPKHELKFKTVKVGKVNRPFKRLVYDPGLLTARTLYYWFPEDPIGHYTDLGFNRIEFPVIPMQNKEFYTGNDPQSNEDIGDLVIQAARQSGKKLYYTCLCVASGIQPWRITGKDPSSHAVAWNGEKILDYNNYPMLCPSYRGKLYDEWRDTLLNSTVFGKYKCTWLATDLEVYTDKHWDKLCFCERCLAGFPKFCRENGKAGFADRKPLEEFKKGVSPEFRKVWGDYMNSLYVEMIARTVNVVRDSVKDAPSTSYADTFIVSDWSPPGGLLAGSLDLYELSAYFTPDLNYKKYLKIRRGMPMRKDMICSTTFGQTVDCPDFFLKAEQVKDTLYEAAAFGMRGVVWFYGVHNEPLRMSYIITGLNAIQPVEDIVADGIFSEKLSCDNPKMQLTRLDAKGEILLGVRAYDAKEDQSGTVRLEDVVSPLVVFDCETKEKIADISPARREFKVTAPKNHCRLLYVGSSEQWENRQK